MRWIRYIQWGLGFACLRVVWLFVVTVIMGITERSGLEHPAWADALWAASFCDEDWIRSLSTRLIPDNTPEYLGLGLIFGETFLVGFLAAAAVQTVIGRVGGHSAGGLRPVKFSGIPLPVYEQIIADLSAAGWKQTATYSGFDAGIDYDSVTLKKQDQTLKFKWEPYFEGRITGPEVLLAELKRTYLESSAGEAKQ